ncbi:GyrI-like domain-containing protein [Ideonella sp. BN130291]|uniref:GyrI-like domain-containing protein n=1 Tax=Ideonella sp. BN130291 TaxID=3112940 RepID=UPI002E2543A0|nr:GyrI-like domain-containing protein [Ideonella sp. BN130291]
MKTIEQTQPITIVGIELRTSNAEAFNTIPPHWQRFTSEGVLARIPAKASDEVVAVYTHFEHEGIDNEGTYSLIIGAPVDGLREVPAGMVSAVIPPSRRVVFPVERGRHDLVGAAWQHIWAQPGLAKTFIADYERYQANGDIDICIGVHR